MKVQCNAEGIRKTLKIIRDGGIIVFPTDTVYGIGCNPYNFESVQRIYKIKNRIETKPLPVLADSFQTVNKITDFDENSKKVASKFWPGALTIIVKLNDVKLKKTLQLQKIAVRIPNHKYLLEVLKGCKLLIGTSANLSGQPSFTEPVKCFQSLKGFDLFLDGGIIQGARESTIIEFIDDELIIHREGAIKRHEILESL